MSNAPELQSLVLLAAIPEFEVGLPGGATTSHTDVLVLARNETGFVVIAVEGKVDEEFGPTLSSKRAEASDGQEERLAYLHNALQLPNLLDGAIRYQLLHRSASAVIVAREFHASAAVMLVHSFSPSKRWFDEYVAFGKALGVGLVEGRALRAPHLKKPPLYLGWVSGDQRFREVVVPASA